MKLIKFYIVTVHRRNWRTCNECFKE